MKSGKEIILKSSNPNFKIKAGAVENYKAPRSVYVNMTSWITVIQEGKNLDKFKKDLRLEIKHYLKTNQDVTNQFEFDSIILLDISPTGIKMDTPTFCTLELNLYQKQNKILPLIKAKNSKSDDLKPLLELISNFCLNSKYITDNEYFEFHLKKKKELTENM